MNETVGEPKSCFGFSKKNNNNDYYDLVHIDPRHFVMVIKIVPKYGKRGVLILVSSSQKNALL